MVFKDRFSRAAAMLLGLAPRNGCSALMLGQPYMFPKPDKPSATLCISYDAGKVPDPLCFHPAEKRDLPPQGGHHLRQIR